MRRKAIGALTVVLLAASSAMAQVEVAGQIEGNVLDPSGAVVPGATVTARHVATSAAYHATTNKAGRFVIPNARLGRYEITVGTPWSRRAVVQGVLVEVGQTASVNITLQLGPVQEEVVVTASTAQQILNTTDAEIAMVVDERRLLELPLDGRNPYHLIRLQPGVYYERTPQGWGDVLIIHGQRIQSINMIHDGVDTQDNMARTAAVMFELPLAAVAVENAQEFRIATANTSAEYSRGGIQISSVTRSGGNDWHGSLFWFHRNTATSANEFFNNSTGVETPAIQRHQFGGRLGGPLIKNKTFFFFGYEQTRILQGIPVNRLVYTEEARSGIFRYVGRQRTTPESVAANPDQIWSADILQCGANVQAALGRDCLDDRFDLSSPLVSDGRVTLDPFISTTVFPSIPLPNNFIIGDGLNTGGFRFNSRNETFQHLPAFRFDHLFSERHAAFATVNYTDRNMRGDLLNGYHQIFPAFEPSGSRITHSRAVTGGLNSSFTPAFTNELRFGMISGENALLANQPYDTPEFTLSLRGVQDPYRLGAGDEVRDNETWHLRDTASWVKGKHQLKFGGEWRHIWVHRYDFWQTQPYGSLWLGPSPLGNTYWPTEMSFMLCGQPVWSPAFSWDCESRDIRTALWLREDLVGTLNSARIKYNVASLHSGFVAGAPARRKYRVRESDAFVNDTWQIHPRVTLNLGLRWEFATVPFETQGLLLLPEGGGDAAFGVSGPEGLFNPGVFNGIPCREQGYGLADLPMAPTTDNILAFINSCATHNVLGGSNNGRPLWDDDYNNFGPSLSFAWDPFGDGKTSIRAGYRISYFQDDLSIILNNVEANEGLAVTESCHFGYSLGFPGREECPIAPPFPYLLRSIVDANGDIIANRPTVPPPPPFRLPYVCSFMNCIDGGTRTYAKNLGTPYYQEWNLSVSHEFARDTAVEVRYVGNRGLGLRRVADFNEVNIHAYDPVTGMTFLDAFLIARDNFFCNEAVGIWGVHDLGNAGDPACAPFPRAGPNPLIDDLTAGDRWGAEYCFSDEVYFGDPAPFVYSLVQYCPTQPSPGEPPTAGGVFWGQVLQGRFPANFLMANPFVDMARRMINDGFSTYHAIQLEVRRRLSQGLMFQANYTFNRALTDFDPQSTTSPETLLDDVAASSVRNRRYQVRDIMPRHMVKANWIYELPFGPGKALAPVNRVWRRILEGWQTGGILYWRSGRPISITSGMGTFHVRPYSHDNTVNLSHPMTDRELRRLMGRRSIGGGVFWLDPCMSSQLGAACTDTNAIASLFQLPSPGELGQLSHTPIFGPGLFLFDFSLMKRTRLTETIDVDFRWEVFNLANTPNFGVPDTDIFSADFGQITNTVETPRTMQFALRVNF